MGNNEVSFLTLLVCTIVRFLKSTKARRQQQRLFAGMLHRLVAIYVGLWGFIEDNIQISRLLSKVRKVMGRKPSCGAATARLLIEFCSALCGESFLFCAVTSDFLFYSWNQMIYLLNWLHSWCPRPYSLNIIRLRYWKHIQMTLRIMFLWVKIQWKHKLPGYREVRKHRMCHETHQKRNQSNVEIKTFRKLFLFM